MFSQNLTTATDDHAEKLIFAVQKDIVDLQTFLSASQVSVGSNIKKSVSHSVQPTLERIQNIVSESQPQSLGEIQSKRDQISGHHLHQFRFHKYDPDCCISGSKNGGEHARVLCGLSEIVPLQRLWESFSERRHRDIKSLMHSNGISLSKVNQEQYSNTIEILLELMQFDTFLIVHDKEIPSSGLFAPLAPPLQLFCELYVDNIFGKYTASALKHLATTTMRNLVEPGSTANLKSPTKCSKRGGAESTTHLLEYWRGLLDIEQRVRTFSVAMHQICSRAKDQNNAVVTDKIVENELGIHLGCFKDNLDQQETKHLGYLFNLTLQENLSSLASQEDTIIFQNGPHLFVPSQDSNHAADSTASETILCGTRKLVDVLMASSSIVSDGGILGLSYLSEFSVIVYDKVSTYLTSLVDRVVTIMNLFNSSKPNLRAKVGVEPSNTTGAGKERTLPQRQRKARNLVKQAELDPEKHREKDEFNSHPTIFGQLENTDLDPKTLKVPKKTVTLRKIGLNKYTLRLCYASLSSVEFISTSCKTILDIVEPQDATNFSFDARKGFHRLQYLYRKVLEAVNFIECHVSNFQSLYINRYILSNAPLQFESRQVLHRVTGVKRILFSYPLVMRQYYLDSILHDIQQLLPAQSWPDLASGFDTMHSPTMLGSSHVPHFQNDPSIDSESWASLLGENMDRKSWSSLIGDGSKCRSLISLRTTFFSLSLNSLRSVVDNFTNPNRPDIMSPIQFVKDVTYVIVMCFWDITRARSLGSTSRCESGIRSPALKLPCFQDNWDTSAHHTQGTETITNTGTTSKVCCSVHCSKRPDQLCGGIASLCGYLLPLAALAGCSEDVLLAVVNQMLVLETNSTTGSQTALETNHKTGLHASHKTSDEIGKQAALEIETPCPCAIHGVKTIWELCNSVVNSARSELLLSPRAARRVETRKPSLQQDGKGTLTGFKPLLNFGGSLDVLLEPRHIVEMAISGIDPSVDKIDNDMPSINWEDFANLLTCPRLYKTCDKAHINRVIQSRLLHLTPKDAKKKALIGSLNEFLTL